MVTPKLSPALPDKVMGCCVCMCGLKAATQSGSTPCSFQGVTLPSPWYRTFDTPDMQCWAPKVCCGCCLLSLLLMRCRL